MELITIQDIKKQSGFKVSKVEASSLVVECSGIPLSVINQMLVSDFYFSEDITDYPDLLTSIRKWVNAKEAVSLGEYCPLLFLRQLEDIFYLRPLGKYYDFDGEIYTYKESQRNADMELLGISLVSLKDRMYEGIGIEQIKLMLPSSVRLKYRLILADSIYGNTILKDNASCEKIEQQSILSSIVKLFIGEK